MRLRALVDAQVRAGRGAWIGPRPARPAPPVAVDAAGIAPDGRTGAHARPGKRAVTLVRAKHLPVIAARCDGAATSEASRRNRVVSGIYRATLRGRRVCVDGAALAIEGPCAPCARMEEAPGPGGDRAVRDHGGWWASVAAPGRIAPADAVVPC